MSKIIIVQQGGQKYAVRLGAAGIPNTPNVPDNPDMPDNPDIPEQPPLSGTTVPVDLEWNWEYTNHTSSYSTMDGMGSVGLHTYNYKVNGNAYSNLFGTSRAKIKIAAFGLYNIAQSGNNYVLFDCTKTWNTRNDILVNGNPNGYSVYQIPYEFSLGITFLSYDESKSFTIQRPLLKTTSNGYSFSWDSGSGDFFTTTNGWRYPGDTEILTETVQVPIEIFQNTQGGGV
jgi:hypothetical protein